MSAPFAVSDILGKTADGLDFSADLDRLIGSHACIIANAGGGKSGLIRRLLETTHGRVQHIVLDVEDEFYTLRERFDYVIAGGDGGDAPVSVESAGALALATLQHGFSLIAQLNDLGPEGAPAFVGAFLQALIMAPRDLWRPVLVVLDEAQRFAPQDGSTAATAGVKALTAQGRKRGFTAVLASQRLAKIDKDVTGDVNNWMLGRVGQSADRRALADALGFSPSSAEARDLQSLPQRTFWGFGPALSSTPVLFKVSDVETTPVKPGQAKVPTPPPPEALRSILSGLAAAPVAPAEPPATVKTASGADLAAAERRGYERGLADGEASGEARGITVGIARSREAINALRINEPVAVLARAPPAPEARPPRPPLAPKAVGLSRATQAIIATLEAAWPRALTFVTAAKHAGVGLKSSQFRTYEPELRASGRAEEVEGKWRALAQAPSGVSLIDAASARLSPSHARVLDAVRGASGALTKDEIAVAAAVSPTSSTTGAALSILQDMDLVERQPDGRYRMAEAFA